MRKKRASGREEKELEALRESESWLRLIMENTTDGINIAEYDPQTHRRRLVMCNDRYIEMSGRSREEMMEADNINQFVRWSTPRDRPFHEQTLKGLPSEGTASWLRPDGKENCYEWTAAQLKVDDKYYIIGIDRDVTERNKAEERLQRLAMIADQVGEGVVVSDLDGVLQFVNTAWARMHGYESGSELVGEHLSIFHSPEQMKTDVIPFNKKVKLKGCNAGEVRHIRVDGAKFPTEMTVTRFKNEQGKPIGLLAFAIDINDRKKAEEALLASELQYRTTLDSMGDAIHVVDKDLRIILCNPALKKWCKRLGLSSKLEGLTIFKAFPFLTEEVRDEYQHVFKTGKALVREETNTFGKMEFKLEARKIPILDKGKVVQIVTVIRDVTEHKKAEERLRRLAMIAEQAVEGIGMADLDGTIQFINPLWARMHGYETGQELVGKHISVFHTPEQMKTYVNPFNEEVKRTGRHMGESEQLRKDGTTFPSEMAVTLFKDEGGKPVGFLAFAIDITDRRKAEETLRKSEDDLRKRVKELNCLFQVTEVINACGDSLDALLQGIVDILPESCQYPGNACARITFGGKEYRTGNFRKSPSKLAVDILVAGEKAGVVEFFCLKEKPAAGENPFLKEERSLIDTVAARIGRNIERIQARRRLLAEQSALQEKNIALREVLAGIRDEKKELGRRIVSNVEKIVMPLLYALEQELPQEQRKYVELLKGSLEDITLPFADRLSKDFASLTPTEIRICNLIGRGLSTKDIARLQHVSPATVNKHREHIRRKLGITNKDVNLAAYLENFMSGRTVK